jgi:hypothetical protein
MNVNATILPGIDFSAAANGTCKLTSYDSYPAVGFLCALKGYSTLEGYSDVLRTQGIREGICDLCG